MPPGTDLTYTWSQAQADLGQIAPVVALTGFFLLALVTDLIIPRPRRGGPAPPPGGRAPSVRRPAAG